METDPPTLDEELEEDPDELLEEIEEIEEEKERNSNFLVMAGVLFFIAILSLALASSGSGSFSIVAFIASAIAFAQAILSIIWYFTYSSRPNGEEALSDDDNEDEGEEEEGVPYTGSRMFVPMIGLLSILGLIAIVVTFILS